MNDLELLQAYVRDGSQSAFSQLVEGHVNLVYSAAYRLVRDGHLAEDVTQQVFTLLARKGSRLSTGTILSAWLYRAARHIASETLRRETRRQRREQAATEAMTSSAQSPTWLQIAPLLDEAMAALNSADHDVIVLRYFEDRSLKEVAAALGSSEDAAQKRVARALERLRHHLAGRGVALSVGAIAAAVSGGAVQSAPAGLAMSAASASVAAVASASAGVITTFLLTMTTSKLRLIVAGAILAALALPVLLYRQNAVLRREVAALKTSAQESTQSSAGSDASQSGSSNDELRRLRREHLELLALRGRVAQMANELRAKQGPLTAATQSSQEDQTRDSILFTASLTNRVAHGSTLVVGGWARDEMRGYLLLTPSVLNGNLPGAEPQVAMQSQVIGAPDHFWQQIGWGPYRSDTRRSTMAGVLSSEQLASLLQVLKETDTAWLSNISVATNRNEERFGFGWSLDDDQGAGLMMGIDTYPRIASDGQSVDLELRPSRNPSETDIHSSMRAR